ncbi:hypothetical protein SDC9_130263 [bioreactor metagenome]|uniref:EamA domain-containing protein n=1 Tax=bioreactor metagenome TaxID=1076179 RepID=A0A645D107_9ZZZZ
MIKNKTTAANAALFVVAVIWGGGYVAGKMALTGFEPFVILAYRFLLSALICGFIFHKKIKNTSKKTALRGMLIGFLQFVALSVQLVGLKYTTSAKQSFLCTAYVALVPFISWFVLKKRPSLKAFIAGFLALIGIGFISLSQSLTISFGDALSLGFAVFFGVQIVLICSFVCECDCIQLTFFQILTAGVLSAIMGMIKGQAFVTYSTEALLGVGYLIVFNTLIAFIVQNIAQKYTSDTTASLILSYESLFGFVFSIMYYHDTITSRLLVGCVLCFAAVLISNLKIKRRTQKNNSRCL